MIGAAALAVSLAARPALSFDLDRPLPPFVQGFHGLERDDQLSYAWTTGRVSARLDGLDRRVAWLCTMRLAAPRPESAPAPTVEALVDGARVASIAVTSAFSNLGFAVPVAPRPGLELVFTVTPTFTPGTSDARDLGVQVDRFECHPRTGWIRPPMSAMLGAGIAAGVLAAMFAVLGAALPGVLAMVLVVAAAPAALMTIDGAVYGRYPHTIVGLAAGMSVAAAILAMVLERWRRRRLTAPARFVVACATTGLFIKLVGLLHPAKPMIDAMFHAHRLDMVLGGQFFFTQLMPNGVTFPYAIGLYIVAAPWAWITADHVALVRIVAATAEAIGGALLYPMIVRAWDDRRTGALAVAFFQMVPLSYAVLGNANLTNSFGQSAALFVLAAVVVLPLGPGQWGQRLGLAALAALALCSHVSTVTLLSGVLVATLAGFYWFGGASMRQAARSILLATALAMGFSVAAYWGHFGSVYRTAIERVWAGPETTVAPAAAGETPVEPGGGAWGRVQGPSGLRARAANAAEQAAGNVGWPMLVLAVAGAWSVVKRGLRDRLSLVLLAWAVIWIGASAWTIATRVDYAYLRYAAEFLGRINLATYPLVVVLAAGGVAWAWRDDLAPSVRMTMRIASAVLVLASARLAVDAWLGWFTR